MIARRALLQSETGLAGVFDFAKQDAAGSMIQYATGFWVYLIDLVLEWIEQSGGVDAMNQRAQARSENFIMVDQSTFYSNPVAPAARSRMNVPFLLADESLNEVCRSRESGSDVSKGAP